MVSTGIPIPLPLLVLILSLSLSFALAFAFGLAVAVWSSTANWSQTLNESIKGTGEKHKEEERKEGDWERIQV